MKVKDYMNDMTSGQKWAVEVHTTLCHDSVDIEVSEGLWKTTENFEENCIDTYHYFSSPFVSHCPFDDFPVKSFRIVNDELVLVVNRVMLV